MNENIDKEFTLQYEVIENGWIKTLDGIIYTENDVTGESALEVYERVLREKDNPPIPVPTLDERVKEQEDKISILKEENEQLRQGLKAVLSGDVQTLAYILYPEDFDQIIK